MNGMTCCIIDTARIDNKLGITMPGGGVLPTPFPASIGITRAEILLAGQNQSRIRKRARRCALQQQLCCILCVCASALISLRVRTHKLLQELRLLFDLVWTAMIFGV